MTLVQFDVRTAISSLLKAFSLGFKAFSSGGGYRGRTDDLLNAINADQLIKSQQIQYFLALGTLWGHNNSRK